MGEPASPEQGETASGVVIARVAYYKFKTAKSGASADAKPPV